MVFEAMPQPNHQVLMVTQRGHMKRLKWSDINQLGRAKRGLTSLKELKTHPHRLVSVQKVWDSQQTFEVIGSQGSQQTFKAVDIPIGERYSNGSKMIDESKLGEVQRVTPLFDLETIEID